MFSPRCQGDDAFEHLVAHARKVSAWGECLCPLVSARCLVSSLAAELDRRASTQGPWNPPASQGDSSVCALALGNPAYVIVRGWLKLLWCYCKDSAGIEPECSGTRVASSNTKRVLPAGTPGFLFSVYIQRSVERLSRGSPCHMYCSGNLARCQAVREWLKAYERILADWGKACQAVHPRGCADLYSVLATLDTAITHSSGI